MAKNKSIYVCQACGGESVKWYGRCPSCGEWNTLVEEVIETQKSKSRAVTLAEPPRPVTQVSVDITKRLSTGLSELDGVLGGGLVPGSLVLLGGEPGIGKSTLLLQAAKEVADRSGPVLYASGEESAGQVGLRARRLAAVSEKLLLLANNNVEDILAAARNEKPAMLVVDSIQSVYLPELSAAPGSVSQVRQCGNALLEYAKESGVSVLLVGHVTKEGTLAGPRVLEHMVDTVLYFEGERYNAFRLLRAVKNRFGSTNEIGAFEMQEQGLMPLSNPSGLFLAQRPQEAPGSVVTCAMQGSRPVLLEIQALVAPSSFGNPRRLSAGIDYNRLLIIVAVLEKKLGLHLGTQDIYVNVAGGMRVDDPAVDLAIAAAIVSSYRERALEESVMVFGEVGLTGEVRQAGQSSRRLKEGAKFGFTCCVLPQGTYLEGGSKMHILESPNVAHALLSLGLE